MYLRNRRFAFDNCAVYALVFCLLAPGYCLLIFSRAFKRSDKKLEGIWPT